MTGQFYINNKDAWTNWSAVLTGESFGNFLTPAGLKPPVENESRLQNGKSVYYDVLKQPSRTFLVEITITGSSTADYLTKLSGLITELNLGVLAVKVVGLKTIYNVNVDGVQNLKASTGIKAGRLSIRFCEPNPVNRTAL